MKKGNLIILGSVVVAVLLITTGSLMSRSNNHLTDDVYTGAQNTEEGGIETNLAPDFTLDTLNGETITLSSYIGVKPVILDFWASWCPNCRRAMPKLSKIYEEHNGRFEVIGVNLHEKDSVVEKYITSAGIKFPIALDRQSVVARAYGVQYTNYHVLINTDGTIAGVVPGDISESQINSFLEANPSI